MQDTYSLTPSQPQEKYEFSGNSKALTLIVVAVVVIAALGILIAHSSGGSKAEQFIQNKYHGASNVHCTNVGRLLGVTEYNCTATYMESDGFPFWVNQDGSRIWGGPGSN